MSSERGHLDRRRFLASALALGGSRALGLARAQGAVSEPLPPDVTPETMSAVRRGLAWLAGAQSSDGGFTTTPDGVGYPVAMTALAGMALLAGGSTPSRGPHAEGITRALRFLTRCSTASGLVATSGQDSGRPMHGHGFALLFLATAYGMEKEPARRKELAEVIRAAVQLTARGQSPLGGWTYWPGGGDEGSVTVTQIQGLRAAHAAGFLVPQETVAGAVRYLERCRTTEGGIRYSAQSSDQTELPITAAAVATLYNAGQYDSELAVSCRDYVFARMRDLASLAVEGGEGHVYYTHLYASQAFYQAGEEYWSRYFPRASRLFVAAQGPDGAWVGDSVGPVYGTAVALIVLQMPFKLLPVYQR